MFSQTWPGATLFKALARKTSERRKRFNVSRLDRRTLRDIGVAELPNGLFVKLELN